MKSQLHHLKNGLPVLFVATENFPTLSTILMVGAGSRYETRKNNGISHFLEHMAFKGSKHFPTSFDISSTIEGLGGVFNAYTSKETTVYYIKAPNSHFQTVVKVLSDMVLHPLLKPQEIEKEKGVIIEEINMYEDMPARKVGDVFDELVFGSHPLGYDISGTAKTVSSFTQETFRKYMNSHYYPDNAVLVVAGGFAKKGKTDMNAYLETISHSFSVWGKGISSTSKKHTNEQNSAKIRLQQKKTEQAHLVFGFPTFGFLDERRYALGLLAAMLGGGMSSRLFMEVRERRGLCYYISSGRDLYVDTGVFATNAGIRNDNNTVNEALEVIWDEHQKFTIGQFDDTDLRRAKEQIKGGLLLSLESSHSVGSMFGSRYLFTKEILSIDELLSSVEKVTKEEVTMLAKEMFRPEKMNLAIIGPFKQGKIRLP